MSESPLPNAIPLLERLKHPVFGAFTGSWLICNWKPVYLIICGFRTPEDTITEVTSNYLSLCHWISTLLEPTGLTLFFLIAGPFLHDGYELIKQRINASINKFEPIPKYVYMQTQHQLEREMGEKRLLEDALMAYGANQISITLDNGTKQNINLRDVIRQMNGLAQEKQELSIAKMKLEGDVIVLREENERLKGKK